MSDTTTDAVRDVIVIGSGPAGLTAAIYTARANLEPLVLEGEPSSTTDQPGGQLMLTTEVENFPGFPTGVMGPELMQGMREQALRFGADIRTEKVSKVDFSARPFGVWVGDPGAPEPTYRGRTVIVSTGARSLMLELPNENELIGRGLSTCATCDGFFFRDQEIAVVGGGDSAIEEATFLTKFASKVTIIHRRDELRASKIMQDRAFKNDKIEFLWNTVVEAYLTDPENPGKLAGLTLRSTETDEVTDRAFSGVFIAIGHRPNTDLFKGQLAMEDSGYLVTGAAVGGGATGEMASATDVDGVFACGDVQDHTYRQAITAAGSGCQAAIDAERWLEANDDIDEVRTETDW